LQPRYEKVISFPVGGRSWRLEVASRPALEAEIAANRPALILAGGVAITALLMLIAWSLATTWERAREIAHHMTIALRASEERLQLALASSHLALFDWDVAAGLVQLSPEWSAMLGGRAAPTLVPIQNLQALVHPDDAATVTAQVQALLAGQADSYRIEHRVRRQDGSWKWIESAARVNERDAGGRALRVTGANADIDERKKVERMKNEFIAVVNHELRTPLTSMLASLALVREGSTGDLPPEARQFVEIAYDNCERLAALVNDILDIERIEAGRMEIRLEAVELGALLQRAIGLNAAYAERFGVRLAGSDGGTALRIRADPDRLMQALTNLLSNAAKHSPRGGDVIIAVADAGTSARISVSDRGPGIAPEFRARLFGRFEQADRAHGGTGLGLAIAKALVEKMGGRIGCDSEPGTGSTFWIELPKA
jgi:PAS domain S-box-containing protein